MVRLGAARNAAHITQHTAQLGGRDGPGGADQGAAVTEPGRKGDPISTQLSIESGARRRYAALIVVALVAVATLVAPASSVAQQGIGPTDDQYDPTSELIQGSVDECASADGSASGSGASGDPAASASGDPACRDQSTSRIVSGLPFTGLDAGFLLGVAALLGLAGFGLRRLAHTGRRA